MYNGTLPEKANAINAGRRWYNESINQSFIWIRQKPIRTDWTDRV